LAQKLIIDADPGIGDAVAIALAILDPEIDLLALTATAGVVSGQDATRNSQALVEALDPPKLPRVGGSSLARAHVDRDFAATAISYEALNGPRGLGDWQFRTADLHNRHESAKLIADVVRTYPNEVTLLTLGPLTNVELACERMPDLLSRIKGLVVLGGSVEVGGDVTAVAEFNVYANAEAARTILRSPATKTLVPLDVSNRVVLTFEQFDRLPTDRESPVGRLLGELIPYALRAHHQHLGVEGVRLNEVTALATISHPQLFETRPMAIDVETKGELTRGMTVFDRRGTRNWQTNIDVVRNVDTQGVLDYLARILQRAA
jgi:inosine-uridine nucleoside N-ribohydrolase